MPRRIRILERVVSDIAVAVEVLGVGRVGDEAVGTDKAARAARRTSVRRSRTAPPRPAVWPRGTGR